MDSELTECKDAVIHDFHPTVDERNLVAKQVVMEFKPDSVKVTH